MHVVHVHKATVCFFGLPQFRYRYPEINFTCRGRVFSSLNYLYIIIFYQRIKKLEKSKETHCRSRRSTVATVQYIQQERNERLITKYFSFSLSRTSSGTLVELVIYFCSGRIIYSTQYTTILPISYIQLAVLGIGRVTDTHTSTSSTTTTSSIQ